MFLHELVLMPFSSKCLRSAHEQHHNHPNTPQLVGKADSQDPPLPPVLLNQNTYEQYGYK